MFLRNSQTIYRKNLDFNQFLTAVGRYVNMDLEFLPINHWLVLESLGQYHPWSQLKHP